MDGSFKYLIPVMKFSQDDINILAVTHTLRTPTVYSGNDLHFVAPRL